mgnify:CR=1 FL=1
MIYNIEITHKQEIEKMSRNRTTTLTWTLTAIPEADTSTRCSIDDTHFLYGRTNDEIEDPSWTVAKPLPSGILRIVKESEIDEIALETGFVIEISSYHRLETQGWHQFNCALFASKRGRYRRGVYVCAETANSMEMMNLSCCPPKELPKAIWVRVSKLPERTLAWVLSSSLKGSVSTQMSLRDFSDLGDLSTPSLGKPLALPGPPSSPYEFM